MDLTVGDLQKYAVLFVTIGLVLTLGLSVMSGVQDAAYAENTVLNETFNVTSSGEIYTVTKASESTFYQVTDVTCYETESQDTELGCEISDAEAGKIEVTGTPSTDNTESTDYDYEYEGDAYEGAGSALTGITTFTEWLPLIALVIIAAVIIGLVSMFRSSGTRKSA